MASPAPSIAPLADRRAALDRAHLGDIEGAIGTVRSYDTAPRRSLRRRLMTLLAVAGPGLIVMAADNDAGTMTVFSQAGHGYGTRLLWVLVLLAPVLFVVQEMAARLGAVTGAGHARLILERFGRLWCAFSLGDLIVLNFALLVTEFIGVTVSLGYFGVSRYLAVPIAAAGLIAVTAGGSFRRWERAMYVLVAADLSVIALALLHHPSPAAIGAGLLPGFSGRPGSPALLLLIALIGTTISPWQIFFQQSNVIDKRITPRWLRYARIDTALGTLAFVVAAGAIMIGCAGMLGSGGADPGHLIDAGAIARLLALRAGGFAGGLFAVALLNASLLGAGAVSLSSSYSASEVLGVKHSLHRRFRDARIFHGCFAAFVIAAAATVLIPGAPLGTVTTLVQALAGILLPVALVLLLMLCNDRELVGPLTNPRWLNAIAIAAVALILGLVTLLTLTTVVPGVSVLDAALLTAASFAVCGVALGATLKGARSPRSFRHAMTAWQRLTWSSPMLERIPAASATRARLLALALLRGYTLIMLALLAARLGSLLAHA
ncbi:MAG TPA: divalent metal cation transporter [Solirubrobacteraceae bacterium]|nr:divalent metal cation transporter [Solirubrobacteraceae bacterium]